MPRMAMVTFDTRVLRLRAAERALLNSELARKARVSATAMSCAMRGGRISVRLARKIAKALCCPVDTLVARIDPTTARPYRRASAEARRSPSTSHCGSATTVALSKVRDES